MRYFDLSNSPEENKKLYRQLSMKYHPDRPQGNQEIMQQIIEEYKEVEKLQKAEGSKQGPERSKGIKKKKPERSQQPEQPFTTGHPEIDKAILDLFKYVTDLLKL